jgi:hypothetical protein
MPDRADAIALEGFYAARSNFVMSRLVMVPGSTEAVIAGHLLPGSGRGDGRDRRAERMRGRAP